MNHISQHFSTYFIKPMTTKARLQGRADRAEYWYFVMYYFLVKMFLLVTIGSITLLSNLIMLYEIYAFIVSMSILTRRMHDTNRSGAWVLAYVISYLLTILLSVNLIVKLDLIGKLSSRTKLDVEIIINTIVANQELYANYYNIMFFVIIAYIVFNLITFIFSLQEGNKGSNKYGVDPKNLDNSAIKKEPQTTVSIGM